MDIVKQVAYWTTGAAEDFDAAETLLEKGHLRHSLFFAHLALEKMLKALVTQRTRQVPPNTHNLIRLAVRGDLRLDRERDDFLREFGAFEMEGRYPDSQQLRLSVQEVREELKRAQEVLVWLRQRL